MSEGGGYGLLIFMKRKAGLSLAEFRAYYEDCHVPLCMGYMKGPIRYTRRYRDPIEGEAEPDFDVVTELVYPDAAMRDGVLAAMAAGAMPDDVQADEANFLDRSKTRAIAVSKVATKLEQPA